MTFFNDLGQAADQILHPRSERLGSRHTEVGRDRARLHEPAMHRAHGGGVLRPHGHLGPSPLHGVPRHAASEPNLFGRIHEHGQIQPIGQVGHGEQKDPFGHDHGPGPVSYTHLTLPTKA